MGGPACITTSVNRISVVEDHGAVTTVVAMDALPATITGSAIGASTVTPYRGLHADVVCTHY